MKTIRPKQPSRKEFRLYESVAFERPEKFAMSKCRRGRSETDLPRGSMDQMVRGKRLQEPGLPISASSKHHALGERCSSAPDDHIDRSVFSSVFPRRGSSLHRVSHL